MDIKKYWEDVLRQDAEAIRNYFAAEAYVNWHNSNEHFNVEEFIRANCEYPGDWDGAVERVEQLENLIISAVHVWSRDDRLSFHVTSFIKLKEDKIISVDEYWGEDGTAPQWRLDKHIGTAIHSQTKEKEHR